MIVDKMLVSEVGAKELMEISAREAQRNKTPFDKDQALNIHKYAGCTACVALITRSEIYCANAGDSRCVIQDGVKVKEMSIDHKADLPAEKRRIERAGGYVEEGRVNGILAVARAIGDFEYKQSPQVKAEDQMVTAFPEVKVETLTNKNEYMLVACDGIWDCVTS